MVMHWMLFLGVLWTPPSTLPTWHREHSRSEKLQGIVPYQRESGVFLRMALRMGGGHDTEEALSSMLEALARCQREDGSWEADDDASRVEVTSLALLAFLSAGWNLRDQQTLKRAPEWRSATIGASAQARPPYHVVLRRGVAYLLRRQNGDGFIGDREARHALRGHAVAARALSEAYGWSGLTILRQPAERALTALVAEAPSWTQGDPELAGWAALALRSAMFSDLPFDAAAWDDLKSGTRGNTAVELLISCLLSRGRRNPAFRPQPLRLADLKATTPRERYWTGLALAYGDGPEGMVWKRWNERMKSEVLPTPASAPESLAFRALLLTVYYPDNVY